MSRLTYDFQLVRGDNKSHRFIAETAAKNES